MILMKSLKTGAMPRHYKHEGFTKWPLPNNDDDNWFGPVQGTLKPHANGFHLADLSQDAILWFDEENYIAEVPYSDWDKAVAEGNMVIDDDCVIAREARLVQKLTMKRQDWKDLAFRLAEPTLRLPDFFGMPHEYGQVLQNLFFYLRDRAAPFSYHNDLREFQSSVEKLIERASQDARHTLRYRDCPEAMAEVGRCILTLTQLSPLATNKVTPTEIVRLVADYSVKAHRLAALSFDCGDTSFTNHNMKTLFNYIPPNMPERYRGNIAHRALFNLRLKQNAELLKKFGLSDLKLSYESTKTSRKRQSSLVN